MSTARSPRRRAYGTGTLRVVGGSWLASWYGPDGRRVQRKVGAVRTEGRADGLTKAQAERVLRRMREIESPRSAPDGQRVTMEQAGDELCQRLELRGRRKSHRLTVASDLRNHIAPFFAGKTLDRIRPEDIERYVAAKRKTLAIKTIRNHVNTMHSVFELGLRKGWCQIEPGEARRSANGQEDRDADPVSRPGGARGAAWPRRTRTTRSAGSSRRCT